ncbi:hypothetical protein AM440_00845 [Escherichia coli]|nr:hypothetical protein AM440_00845 [Escherichia coli]OOC68130.1 hypothetical protein BWP13_13700 [Escherichia coli ATCC 8739]ARV37287.1 hypothetical protein BUQ71_23455 [Escherichia coli]OKV43288.1 hypothetical protein AWP58_24070 [Escherichia coli]OKW64739.1 hypothetical protein AWP73_13835 [Escherichia coli]
MSLKSSRTLCSVTKVGFVPAGCGVNALSGLQMLPKFNILMFCRTDKRSASGNGIFANSFDFIHRMNCQF